MEDNKALLSSLQVELKDKIIIDVTNVFWVLGESEWGQVSSTLINEAALGTTARCVHSPKTHLKSCYNEIRSSYFSASCPLCNLDFRV